MIKSQTGTAVLGIISSNICMLNGVDMWCVFRG